MKAATPPFFWASPMVCSVRVVLPEDSGPNISVTLPLGIPPTPSAISSPKDPVDIAGTSAGPLSVPNLMIAPFPNCFSICERASSNAFILCSFSPMSNLLLFNVDDGFVKSPSAALRCILRHCGVAISTPHSSEFARLRVPTFVGDGAFFKAAHFRYFLRFHQFH